MSRTIWLVWLMLGIAAGCNKETLEKLPSVDEAKQAVVNVTKGTTETVKQSAGMAGRIEGDFGGPITTVGCYAGWLVTGEDRPSALLITSYHDPQAEKFPSVLIRCLSDQPRLAELANKSVLADRVFVQESPESPVWELPLDQAGKVTLQTASDLEFAGNISADLINTETGQMRKFACKFGGEVLP